MNIQTISCIFQLLLLVAYFGSSLAMKRQHDGQSSSNSKRQRAREHFDPKLNAGNEEGLNQMPQSPNQQVTNIRQTGIDGSQSEMVGSGSTLNGSASRQVRNSISTMPLMGGSSRMAPMTHSGNRASNSNPVTVQMVQEKLDDIEIEKLMLTLEEDAEAAEADFIALNLKIGALERQKTSIEKSLNPKMDITFEELMDTMCGPADDQCFACKDPILCNVYACKWHDGKCKKGDSFFPPILTLLFYSTGTIIQQFHQCPCPPLIFH